MYLQRHAQVMGIVAGTAVMLALAGAGVSGQKAAADIAAKMSGSWKLNRELSPSLVAPGRGRPGGPGGGALFSAAAPAFAAQRGGGRGGDTQSAGGNADLPPDVLAAQAAMRDLQQIAEVLTIKASPESIAFSDPRGERTYAIDNKAARLDSNGARLEVKTRWDKEAVRQEFSTPQMRLIRVWDIDSDNRLVLRLKVESLTLNSKEVKAVYDRQ